MYVDTPVSSAEFGGGALLKQTPRSKKATERRGAGAGLERIQLELEDELGILRQEAEDGAVDARAILSHYGRVWDNLCDEFTAYGPLLATIKAEYDRFIDYHDTQLSVLAPKLQVAKQLEADKVTVAERTHAECAAEREKMQQECEESERELQKTLELAKQAREDLVTEGASLKNKAENLHVEHELNLSLVESIEKAKRDQSVQTHLEETEVSNLGEYKRELDVHLTHYTELVKTNTQLNGEMEEVAKELRARQGKVTQLESSCRALELEVRIGLYSVVTSQYSATTLYHVSCSVE